MTNLDKLADLIMQDRDALLARWRVQLKQLDSARHLDLPTLNDHIPNLLIELATAFRLGSNQTIADSHRGTPPAHGLQRLADGFEIEEVVAEYNILRGCIHDLATEKKIDLQGKPFNIMNLVLDGAIGAAVQTFAERRAQDVQEKREEYLSFVAHDLRTPLNAISLATRVLELSTTDQGKAAQTKKMLHSLHRNVQYLSKLVEKILDENAHLSTELGVKLERRMLDLWPLVENLIHDLHPVAGTDSTHLINLVPEDMVVYADAGLLGRIFQNLIANAIMYTPRGEVTISASVLAEDQGIECCVADNGVGIPAERLDKIFGKFEADPDNVDSLGLGLAIFKTFVEAHGGSVSVQSTPGAGSAFRFVLPGKNP